MSTTVPHDYQSLLNELIVADREYQAELDSKRLAADHNFVFWWKVCCVAGALTIMGTVVALAYLH